MNNTFPRARHFLHVAECANDLIGVPRTRKAVRFRELASPNTIQQESSEAEFSKNRMKIFRTFEMAIRFQCVSQFTTFYLNEIFNRR